MSFDIIIGRNASDKKSFGSQGLIPIGKTYVTMGNYTSLSNPLFLDVARSHVVLIAGRGEVVNLTLWELLQRL